MELVKGKLDPEYFSDKALKELEGVSLEERVAWYQHPCTQSLLFSLEADICGLVLMWLGGAYTNDISSDGTAQNQAKARGQAQAADDVINRIVDIKNGVESGD